MADPAHAHGHDAAPARSNRERARLAAVAILVAAAAIFSLVNLDEVKVDLVFGSVTMPLIIVIVGCLLIGAAIGAVLGRRGGRRAD